MILVILGLFLNLLPDIDFSTLRIPGVLQRIGVCYFIGATTYYLIHTKIKLSSPRDSIAYGSIALMVLLINYLTMHHLNISRLGSESIAPQGAIAAYVDQAAFGAQHLWPWAYVDSAGFKYDPDGILSTLFASSAVIIGLLLTTLRQRASSQTWQQPAFAGFLLTATGLLLNSIIPINKVIWSVSFSVLSVGVAVMVLAVLELCARYLPSKCFLVFDVFGANAILAFLVSSLLLAYHGVPLFAGESAQSLVFNWVQIIISDAHAASLACAVIVTGFIFLLLYPLHKRKLFLKL